jgi:ketosteroid isomerase-like protein
MPVETSAAEVVRRFYAALGGRDMDAIRACLHEDARWVLPGHSPVAGDHRGPDAIVNDFLAKLGPLSGGTFRARLIDVAFGASYVVAVQHATAERGDKRLDITACQLMTIEDGRITSVRGHYSDQYALDEFWS